MSPRAPPDFDQTRQQIVTRVAPSTSIIPKRWVWLPSMTALISKCRPRAQAMRAPMLFDVGYSLLIQRLLVLQNATEAMSLPGHHHGRPFYASRGFGRRCAMQTMMVRPSRSKVTTSPARRRHFLIWVGKGSRANDARHIAGRHRHAHAAGRAIYRLISPIPKKVAT